MLDLVRNETERIDSRFLEPACGHGNFLAAILERKLDAVEVRYGKSRTEFEAQALLGLACIYGIDKLEDNVKEARARLSEIFEGRYRQLFKNSVDNRVLDSAHYILKRNILYGDALTLKTIPAESKPEQNGRPTFDSLRNEGYPIIFSQWSLIDSARFKRHDYLFDHLVNRIGGDGPLFSDQGEEAFIPKSVADFRPVHYLEISHAYDDSEART